MLSEIMLCEHGNVLPCFQCDVEPLELKLLEKEEEVSQLQAQVAELEAQASTRDWMPTLEWGIKRCEALTEQGFDRIRIDVLQRNFVNAIDAHRPNQEQDDAM
jgi:hypothetical protein